MNDILALATGKRRGGRRASPEHDMQVLWFRTVELSPITRDLLIAAIPNAGGYRGGFKSNVVRAARMKAEGVRAGLPDVIAFEPRGGAHGWCCEFKVKPNKPTAAQLAWHAELRARGYVVIVAYSVQEAWDSLVTYLKGDAPHGR